jgi:hypothetical protein
MHIKESETTVKHAGTPATPILKTNLQPVSFVQLCTGKIFESHPPIHEKSQPTKIMMRASKETEAKL